MPSLKSILAAMSIEEVARPSNIRYGQAIFERGGVEYIEQGEDHVEAWVGGLDGSMVEGGSQRRRTRFWLANGELRWHCAGNPKDHQIFCKHCVALALAMTR